MRKTLFFTLFLFLTFLAFPVHTIKADPLKQKLETVGKYYNNGQLNKLISYIEPQLKSKKLDAFDKFTLLSSLLDFCIRAEKPSCLNKHISQAKHFLKNFNLNKTNKSRLSYFVYYERYLSGDLEFFRKLGDLNFSRKHIEPITDRYGHIEWTILSAHVAGKLGHHQQALDFAYQAFHALMALNSAPDRFFAASALAQIAGIYLDNHDTVTGFAILQTGDRFIRSHLPLHSPEAAYYESLLATASMQPIQGSDTYVSDLEQATKRVSALKFEAAGKSSRLERMGMLLSIAHTVRAEGNKALAVLRKMPSYSDRIDILKAGRFSNLQQIDYAFAEIFTFLNIRLETRSDWVPLLINQINDFEKNPSPIAQQKLPFIYYLLTMFTVGSEDTAVVKGFIDKAGGSLLGYYNHIAATTPDAFPIPSHIDKLLLDDVITISTFYGSENADLILASTELLQHSLGHAEARKMRFLTSQPTKLSKNLASSLLKIDQQRFAVMHKELTRWIERSTKKDAATKQANIDAQFLQVYTQDFDEKRQSITQEIDRLSKLYQAVSQTSSNAKFPSRATLSRVLKSNEAFMSVFHFQSGTLRLCVTRYGIWFRKGDLGQAYLGNIKLLRLALTATHPASEHADKQFPVKQSLSVYNALFGNFEECLKQAEHIFFAPPPEFYSFPLEALLAKEPNTVEGGFDLKQADWLFRKYSFSYVPSAQGLIDIRSAVSNHKPIKPFVGIGNPKINLPQSVTTKLEGTISEGILEFDELPETADELKNSATYYQASDDDILLGDNATEFAVRNHNLADYSIIHFATHGLIPQEIERLDQPALMLTPVNGKFAFNDGLLTAEEISFFQLNASLVILSACNSANADSDIFFGEVRSLATAFNTAGVSSLIASLWLVESSSGEKLISSLQKHLADPETTSLGSAFNKALHNYFDTTTDIAYFHPRFWAPFVILGDNKKIIMPADEKAPLSVRYNPDSDSDVISGITSVAAIGDDVITSEMSEGKAGRLASVVNKTGANGSLSWTLKDTDIASGDIHTTPDLIYAIGWISTQNANSKQTHNPVVRGISMDGKLAWQLPISSKESISVSSSSVDETGHLYLLIRPFDGNRNATRLIKISPSGNIVKTVQLKSNLKTSYSSAQELDVMSVKNGTVSLFLNFQSKPPPSHHRGHFSLPTLCDAKRATVQFTIDAETLDMRERNVQAYLLVDGTVKNNDQILVYGRQQNKDCPKGLNSFIATSADDISSSIIWKDLSPFPGEIEGIIPTKNKLKLVLSRKQNLLMRNPGDKTDRTNDLQKGNYYNPYNFQNIVFIDLSATGFPIGFDEVPLGNFRAAINGVHVGNDRIILYGNHVGHAWLGVYNQAALN